MEISTALLINECPSTHSPWNVFLLQYHSIPLYIMVVFQRPAAPPLRLVWPRASRPTFKCQIHPRTIAWFRQQTGPLIMTRKQYDVKQVVGDSNANDKTTANRVSLTRLGITEQRERVPNDTKASVQSIRPRRCQFSDGKQEPGPQLQSRRSITLRTKQPTRLTSIATDTTRQSPD